MTYSCSKSYFLCLLKPIEYNDDTSQKCSSGSRVLINFAPCGIGVEIEGLKFWGVPMFMEDCLRGKQEQLYAAIPEDTDVLVTHTPPLAYSVRTEASCTAQGSCSRECE